jgi:hypothetical protein
VELCEYRVIHGAARRPMCRARARGAVGNPDYHLRRQFRRVQMCEVKRIWRDTVKRTVWPPAVIKAQIVLDPAARRAHTPPRI